MDVCIVHDLVIYGLCCKEEILINLNLNKTDSQIGVLDAYS